MNRCFFIGRLGQDPEIKVSPNGVTVANFSVACSKKIKDKEITNWIRMVAFNKTAELIGEYLKQGSRAHFEGELTVDKYTDKDGNNKTSSKVIVQTITFLDAKSSTENSPKQTENFDKTPLNNYQNNQLSTGDFVPDDIPF